MALTALALASCDKGTDLNVDLPDTTAISTEYKDLDVDVATVRLAPVQTLKTEHFLVGRLADNVAGATEARAYFNVAVREGIRDSLPAKLPTPLLDSVAVVMGFDKVYGSAAMPVKFDVYKLKEPLDERQVYDSNTATPLGDLLGQNLSSRLDRTQQVTTTATTTTPASTTTVPDQTVRLLLQRRAFPAKPATGTSPGHPAISAVESAFATNLFNQLKLPNFGEPQLAAALKGLAVVPSASHNSSIVSFGRTYYSRLVFYFHAADTLRRSYAVYFGPVFSSDGQSAARDPRYYTQITNTLPTALAALSTRAGSVPATLLDGTSYVQEGTGLGTRITFKELYKSLGIDPQKGTQGLTVNRAELRVPVKPFTNVLFSNPGLLYAVEVDSGNNVLRRPLNATLYDRIVQADGFDPLGVGANTSATGLLTDAATSQSYYSIPMTNYLQAYLNNSLGGNPASLVLVPSIRLSNTLSLNRAALDAARIRLRVYYSKR